MGVFIQFNACFQRCMKRIALTLLLLEGSSVSQAVVAEASLLGFMRTTHMSYH
jgi:hypothetical protein